MRSNKHLFEIKKNSYTGNTNLGRGPNNAPIRRQNQGVFMKREGEKLHQQKEDIYIDKDSIT